MTSRLPSTEDHLIREILSALPRGDARVIREVLRGLYRYRLLLLSTHQSPTSTLAARWDRARARLPFRPIPKKDLN